MPILAYNVIGRDDIMLVMAKERKQKKDETKTPQFPSRAGYKGTYLPKALYEILEEFAKEDERSVAFLVHRAVREYAERRGRKPKEAD